MGKGKILWIGGVATSLLLALFIGMLAHSLHHIDEGHVGVYFKYGALQKSLGHPGLNTMTPWVSSVEQITIRPKSEIAYTFTAVTKDAIPITFQNVEVISSVPQENVLWLVKNFGVNFRTILVFDRLREEVKRYAFGMILMMSTMKGSRKCRNWCLMKQSKTLKDWLQQSLKLSI